MNARLFSRFNDAAEFPNLAQPPFRGQVNFSVKYLLTFAEGNICKYSLLEVCPVFLTLLRIKSHAPTPYKDMF